MLQQNIFFILSKKVSTLGKFFTRSLIPLRSKAKKNMKPIKMAIKVRVASDLSY
jgi:hypothetical protein